jgi:C4-dicarboxylate-specific signal transduction histidine kinase
MAAAPEGRRRLTVEARPVGAGRVRLVVRDSGGGVPPEIVNRIFEPFFTTKPVGQGTGLGLALSHGMMAAIGGTIRFANAPEGAEFVLELAALPAVSAEAEEARHIA